MRLIVVGAGYVGLVSGACFAELGHEVVCVDRDRGKIAALRVGRVPIFEPGLEAMIGRQAEAGRLTFSEGLEALELADIDAVFIAVGTPPRAADQGADLTSVFAVAAAVAEHARGPLVVVTKSTVPVGTGDAIEKIIREEAPHLGISVVSNPEFLREGEAIVDFMQPDRIVVGVEDDFGRDVLERLYAPLRERGAEVIFMRRRGAELVKYASNAFLVTKISFINEIADLCEAVDADIAEVARGVGSDRRIGDGLPDRRTGLWRLLLPQGLRRPAEHGPGARGRPAHRGKRDQREPFPQAGHGETRDHRHGRGGEGQHASPCWASPSRPTPTTCAMRPPSPWWRP